jgi:hypothetical protein
VCDAAVAFLVDLSGSTYMDPPTEWILGPPGYWQTPQGPTPAPAYGRAKRYTGSPNSSESVSFTPYTFTYPGVK